MTGDLRSREGTVAEKRDYYEVLGVERSAGPNGIKSAYRKKAVKYHPDRYDGDKAEGERRFKELSEAYEVLSDPEKRTLYDRYGHEGLKGVGMHDFSSMGFGDIFSMFEDIFGGGFGFRGRSARAARRGPNLEAEVAVTLEEVAAGLEKTLEFERQDYCDTCAGSGAKPGTSPEPCSACSGQGRVQQRVRGLLGISMRIVACPECDGRGTVVSEPCEDCGGSGLARKKRVLSFRIPAGIRDGQVIALRGEGEPGRRGVPKGDLNVIVRVRPHSLLARRGNDTVCDVPVPFSIAALGGSVRVPTLDGLTDVKIPPGTQSGEIITLKKHGLPVLGGRGSGDRGRQHVHVIVEVPHKLNKRQKQAVADYAALLDEDREPMRKEYLKKLRECYPEIDSDDRQDTRK